MEIAQRRGEFTLFVVDRDPVAAQALASGIQALGYSNTRFYPTLDSARAMAEQEPPHVLLLTCEKIDEGIEDFLTQMQILSEEILVVLLVPSALYLHSLQIVGRSLAYDSVVRPFASM